MNFIGKNEEVFKYMNIKKLYIINSELNNINIFEEEHKLYIELLFTLSPRNEAMKIRFSTILEYSFYYKENYSFYNVERCKFFKNGDIFYISLDPYDEKTEINERDQDFILCKEIEGWQ